MSEPLFGEHGTYVWISLAVVAIGIAIELWTLRQ